MAKPTKITVNCQTGEQLIEELTDEEMTQLEADRAAAEAERIAREAAEADKSAKRAAAIAKLKALGLTEDEVAALL